MIASVYFEHNRFNLDKKAAKKLDSLAQLKSNLKFRVFGNANPLGTLDLNKKLSEDRAKAVTDYLKERVGSNIKFGNIVGLGETRQINDNSTEIKLAKNRRVDIFIERNFVSSDKISRKSAPDILSVKNSEIKSGDTLLIPNLNFIGGRHVWYKEAEAVLEKLVVKMKENPKMKIELQGHICCEYEDFDGLDLDLNTYNLSWTRANAIRDYLIKNGIKSNRINAVGLGHLNPVVYPEKTERDRTLNRRVEVVILKK